MLLLDSFQAFARSAQQMDGFLRDTSEMVAAASDRLQHLTTEPDWLQCGHIDTVLAEAQALGELTDTMAAQARLLRADMLGRISGLLHLADTSDDATTLPRDVLMSCRKAALALGSVDQAVQALQQIRAAAEHHAADAAVQKLRSEAALQETVDVLTRCRLRASA
jgi:hypothetical protein